MRIDNRDFNPRSLHGERLFTSLSSSSSSNFNPRSLHGERLLLLTDGSFQLGFQSTLPARGATMLSLPVLLYTQISIHAPRTGSDPQGRRPRWSAHHISIHAPRTGSDTAPHQQTRRHPAFQSTLPARGATIPHCCLLPRNGFQSTLPARGATCATAFSIVLTVYFNPRSPHGERRSESCVA